MAPSPPVNLAPLKFSSLDSLRGAPADAWMARYSSCWFIFLFLFYLSFPLFLSLPFPFFFFGAPLVTLGPRPPKPSPPPRIRLWCVIWHTRGVSGVSSDGHGLTDKKESNDSISRKPYTDSLPCCAGHFTPVKFCTPSPLVSPGVRRKITKFSHFRHGQVFISFSPLKCALQQSFWSCTAGNYIITPKYMMRWSMDKQPIIGLLLDTNG